MQNYLFGERASDPSWRVQVLGIGTCTCTCAFGTCNISGCVDLNLLSWSAASNVVALALDGLVFLWNAATGSITELCDLSTLTGSTDDYYSSVSFMPAGTDSNVLALGNSRGDVQVITTNMSFYCC